MNKINLNLDINEVTMIIKALSERPFQEVYELIGKVHAQSNTQLSNHDPQASKGEESKGKK